jgi:hypothetical protein
VPAEVVGTAGARGKPLVALGTRKRFISRVQAHVRDKSAFVRKRLGTGGALERPLASVKKHVPAPVCVSEGIRKISLEFITCHLCYHT